MSFISLRKKHVGTPAINYNYNNSIPFAGFKLLGGMVVCGAILFVAAVRAWRHIRGGGEKGKDVGRQETATMMTTITMKTMDLEEGEKLTEGKWKGETDATTCLWEQRPERVPLLGRTETNE